MQHYATQMLHYLSNSGSQVHWLGISPGANHIMGKRGLEDGSGHSWPEYYYRMGSGDGKGEKTSGKESLKERSEELLSKLKEVTVLMKIGPDMLVNTVFKQIFDANGRLGGA